MYLKINNNRKWFILNFNVSGIDKVYVKILEGVIIEDIFILWNYV